MCLVCVKEKKKTMIDMGWVMSEYEENKITSSEIRSIKLLSFELQ